ncbi:hypothetical protein PAXRUDRAFT_12950 [Paxillus rubicundulus Ve08.2h10]|uniref:Uncharacterized protein n=1 Tax=Paxillus rubicundulus Ve08.2h10 TaxID=930991 RepID=A0A0D0E5V4_9AGAM|nr:hypothetical protein PAXRUDRAFT_12950 [Paxillus rubicundulus Ve08.2h10]
MANSSDDDGQLDNGHRSDDEVQATQTRAKRRIAALEFELETLKASSKKPRQNDTMAHRGRAIRRLITLYDNVEDLIAEYDRRQELAAEDPDQGVFDSSLDPQIIRDQDRLYSSFEELVEFLPWFKKKILHCDADELDDICKQLRKGADGARGDDTAGLKQEIVIWLTDLFHPVEPPLRTTTKDERGFVHDVTGKLICPAEYNWILQSVKDKVRDRDPSHLVTAHSWPLFIYQNFKFDATDAEQGLFRSSLLVKAFKFLFTSPSSARDIDEDGQEAARRQRSSNHKSATKNHVAMILGLKSVTPRAIAYTAVQVRFALSSVGSWRNVDGDFDYVQFYNAIIDFFEVVPGNAAKQRVDELISWWNRKVFGKNRRILLPAAVIANSSVARLAAQRSEREIPSP